MNHRDPGKELCPRDQALLSILLREIALLTSRVEAIPASNFVSSSCSSTGVLVWGPGCIAQKYH